MRCESKIQNLTEALPLIAEWKSDNQHIVFTNGCFDIVHLGHVDYLEKARNLGNKLVLGLNTDASVSRIKGSLRPVVNEYARARVMAAMQFIDLIIFFDDNTPIRLIEAIKPDILTKGDDYAIENIVGADFVIAQGGQVLTIPLVKDYSTSNIINKIKIAY